MVIIQMDVPKITFAANNPTGFFKKIILLPAETNVRLIHILFLL